ncbi:hypothetical protein LSUE1_G010360, partial [Lachnellula suecica]
MDPNITTILTYWFDDPDPVKKWFSGTLAIDSEIKTLFGHLVEKARASDAQFTSWTDTPLGTLALLILLDQFPRNIYRNMPSAFASDAQALRIATNGIARGFDRELELDQVAFIYMPLSHSEDLLAQVACVALYEGLAARCKEEERALVERSVGFARRRMGVVL